MPPAATLAALAAAGGSLAARAALHRWPPGGAGRWARTNHAGDPVTLLEGPAYAVGATTGAMLAGAGPAAVVAGLGAAGLGALDDLWGDSSSKGLRGHLRALREGRLTTGAVKVAGLVLTGLVAAALADRSLRARSLRGCADRPATCPDRKRRRLADPSPYGLRRPWVTTLLGGAVVAGSANLANLFDLRPGRALKVTLLAAVPLGIPGSVTAGAAAGAAAGCLPDDLAGRAMLGDTGANAAGALVGLALVERTGLRGRLVAVAVLTALTLASERVSFTRVIEATPVLRELDALGRPRRP